MPHSGEDNAGEEAPGRVDTYGAGGHLRYCHNIGKHLLGNPARCDYFVLYEGEHGVSSAKPEESYLEIAPD